MKSIAKIDGMYEINICEFDRNEVKYLNKDFLWKTNEIFLDGKVNLQGVFQYFKTKFIPLYFPVKSVITRSDIKTQELTAGHFLNNNNQYLIEMSEGVITLFFKKRDTNLKTNFSKTYNNLLLRILQSQN